MAPHDLGWTIAALNLGGSIFFDLSAIGAYVVPSTGELLSAALANGGTFLGAIGFLVASWLAFAEAGHGWLSWRPHDLGWVIAALNLGGSIFFGLSAIGAYVVPSTGELLSATLANGGTFLGAIGFLIGAALLLREGSSSRKPAPGT